MATQNSIEFVPYLSVHNAAKAIDFYADVFQTSPVSKLDMPDGRVMHCEFSLPGARFFLSDDLPEHGGNPSPNRINGTTVTLHIYVENCDQLVEKMVGKGAELLMEPADTFWGERYGRVRDPFGHEWGIATVVRKMSQAEIKEAADKILRG